MANLIIKSSADDLVLKGSGGNSAITVGSTGNTTLAGTANNVGTVTAGTFNSAIGTSATGFGLVAFSQQYHLTTAFTGSVNATTGWTEYHKYAPTGISMSESSGIWTFPVTGVWSIYGSFATHYDASNDYYEFSIVTCSDGSSYNRNWYGYSSNSGIDGGASYYSSQAQMVLDVTSTSNVKCKLSVVTQNTSVTTHAGNSGSYVIFTRIGDT